MTPTSRSALASTPRQIIGGTIYFIVVAALAAASLGLLDDLYVKSERVASAQARLDEFAARSPRASASVALDSNRSPFLDGRTVTIAGATLEQRMSEAVGKAGGELLSAQVELDGPEAKQGFIGLTASVQVGQAALQNILYDIEAGLPYLFIDKLSIQSPEDFGEQETGLMRITMTVAGQWRPGK